ncbi:MAG: hypothetical protein DWG80_01165 [Chloroflexi bacterium]|nr:hypothetical protein [Chloroflexota bacterium]
MVSARVSLEHGPSRMVWVFRNRGTKALSVGWMTTYDDVGGGGRAGTQTKLLPFRRLMPGRYDIIMARYGVAWPVTLTVDEDAEDPRMMVVSGRVPL